MKIYLDYVFFINFVFDFVLLTGVSILLKRSVKPFKIILGSIIGAISFFILFLNLKEITFLIFKILSGIIMVIITFNYKDLKYTLNNFFYLVILSIIMGGFLYFINIEIGYEHIGIIVINNGKTLNSLILFLLATLITIIYLQEMKKFKINNNLYYKVELYLNSNKYILNGYIDTGNNLYDPYFNRKILIINNNINIKSNNFILVPYKTIDGTGIMKCFKVDKIYIDKTLIKEKVLVGISNDKFNLSGVDIILNKEMIKN